MKNRVEDFVLSYFIGKGDLFRVIMDSDVMLMRAKKIAKGIAKQLMVMGIDRGEILDIGCGTGRIALELAEIGYNVVGVDISPKYIDIAIKKARERGLDNRTTFIVCDARNLELCSIGVKRFDAAIFVWSSVIGYYDVETDINILSSTRKFVKDSGALFLVDFVHKDHLAIESALIGPRTIAYDYGDYVVLEYTIFNPISSEIFIKQRFYRKEGPDLVYIDEALFKMRVYSLSEIVDMARRSGWCLNKVLRDIEGEPGYNVFKPLNTLFTPCKP